jgi:ABC-type antimicrobial peptide transport system permease subunit
MTPEDLHVVGVVADARTVRVSGGVDEIIYQMVDTAPLSISVHVLARTSVPAARAGELFAEAVGSLETGLPITRVERLSDKLAAQLAERRLLARLLGLFSAVALALAAVGLYGVIASVVTERTREIGVRVALGARRTRILTMVLRQAIAMILPGVALGSVGAAALVRGIENRLFGVAALDPLTHAGAAVLLVGVALVAVLAPTRAATRVDPASALRHE